MNTDTMKKRSLQLILQIDVEGGPSNRYTAKPIKEPGVLKGYRLAKEGTPTIYLCKLHEDGSRTCTCKGFGSHKHCKHLEAIEAANLFDTELVLHLVQLQLELEERQARLEECILRVAQMVDLLPKKRQKKQPVTSDHS